MYVYLDLTKSLVYKLVVLFLVCTPAQAKSVRDMATVLENATVPLDSIKPTEPPAEDTNLRTKVNPTKSNLAPPQPGPAPDYQKLNHASAILRECLTSQPTPDPNQGCVDSMRILYDHCTRQRLSYYYYKRNYKELYKDAQYCPLVDDSYIKLKNLFRLDEESCVKGFETVANRLESFHKNKTMIEPEERFVYEYEKHSCKDYKRYVNLCNYVDGDLKNTPAKSDEYLPALGRFMEKNKSCKPASAGDSIGAGASEIDSLIANYVSTKNGDIYNSAIQELRNRGTRTISSITKTSVNNHCEQVRNSYTALGCQKWEKVSDEDPIYLTEDEMKERRLKKIDDAAESDR